MRAPKGRLWTLIHRKGGGDLPWPRRVRALLDISPQTFLLLFF